MAYVLPVLAALSFASGGLFMKYSSGMTRLLPTFAFLLLFCFGAACQALAMKKTEMGAVYILVLGLEAVAALGLSLVFLGERLSLGRVAAAVVILGGIVLLDRA